MVPPGDGSRMAVLEERVARIEKATALQAAEYERRLLDLNHAHAEAQRVQGTYVPRELHAKDFAELDKRIRDVENWKVGVTSGAATATFIGRGIWAVVGGAIAAIVYVVFRAITGQPPP